MKKHNFSAGPAILPQSVKEKASQAALDYEGIGLSLMEISHRGKHFVGILEQTEAHVRQLFNLGDEYAVLFLTGGASTQFFMSAMNLANPSDKVAFVDTGTWSSKSIKEAKLFTNVDVIASSEDKDYTYVPKGYSVPEDAKYLHLTSNNTIYGTQIKDWIDCPCPIVCDMSSDIFSRPVPIEKFGMIYAGAQKNVGPAGVTLAVIRKDLLGKVERTIPTMLDYKTHIAKGSSFNTPPVFPIYVTMLTLSWIIENGGTAAMEKRNAEKANLLYDEIDRNPLFYGPVAKEDRSHMNATFLLNDDSKEKAFLDMCQSAGIVGLKGHRSVGGFRASIYNALDKESVEVLTEVMRNLAS
ncbi:MAG: 3-phosphoserine/phosphohydroxythreonine transaminase [Saprospiraceae bacterium]|nr:3-phosphoserine/phosphohydroxythreonine transaminase [Saprospiraceae bacterium]